MPIPEFRGSESEDPSSVRFPNEMQFASKRYSLIKLLRKLVTELLPFILGGHRRSVGIAQDAMYRGLTRRTFHVRVHVAPNARCKGKVCSLVRSPQIILNVGGKVFA
jgi:hypothetical protein